MDANIRQFETQLRAIELKCQEESENLENNTGKTRKHVIVPGINKFLINPYPEYFLSKDSLK